MTQQSRLSSFLSELKRRRVFRVAAVYGGVAFVLFQIIDSIFEPLHIPEWIGSLIIILLLVGFPVAVALAWVFDITPEGIVRTDRARGDLDTLRRAQGDEEFVEALGEGENVGALGAGGGKPGTSNRALIAIAMLAIAFGVWGRWGGGGDPSAIRSVAVLPFDDYSSEPQEWFSDGITEEIITKLAAYPDLAVTGRTSVMYYKNRPTPVREVAAALGVGAIVEGSVRRHGGRVRITAQLVDAATEKHLWAESYDREVEEEDIISLQDEVARSIAAALHLELAPDAEASATHRPANTEAHHHYLRGLHFWNKRTGEDLFRARDEFQQAIDADPLYARAYVGLADSYNLLEQYAGEPRDDVFPKARAAAERALDIDPGLAEAYVSLAYVAQFYDWDFPTAEKGYRRALELNPSYATGHQWYAEFLSFHGRFEESRAAIKVAHGLDPLSPIITAVGSWIYYWSEDYGRARQEAENALDLQAGFSVATAQVALTMFAQGQYGEWLELVEANPPRYHPGLSDPAQLSRAWEQGGAAALLREAALATDIFFNIAPSPHYKRALYFALADSADELIGELEADFRARLFSVIMLAKATPTIRQMLDDDPRYHALLRNMGLER